MEESKGLEHPGLGTPTKGVREGAGLPRSPSPTPLPPYLCRDAAELGVFAALVPALLVIVYQVLGTAPRVHLLHAGLCLPAHQPAAGRQGVSTGALFPPQSRAA